MRVICDEMEGTIYMDVILSATDFDAIRFGEMVEAQHQTPGFHLFVGVRLNGVSSHGQEKTP